MHERLNELRMYASGLWRYRWHAMLAAWIVAVSGWYFVSTMPDEYKAEARVYVDTETILKPLLEGLTVESTDVQERLELMTKKMLSRPNLQQIVDRLDLDVTAVTPRERDAVIETLAQRIEIERVDSGSNAPNIFRISARSKNPETAKEIVDELLSVFIEGSIGESREDSDAAKRFLDRQIEEHEARLTKAENRLREFKREQIDVLPEQGRSYFERLQEARAALEQAELELQEAEYRRDELRLQLQDARDSTDGVLRTETSPIQTRIRELQSRLDALRMKYTEKHPAVVETKDAIASLQHQLENGAEGGDSAKPDSEQGDSPIMDQEIKLALGEAEADLAAIRVRRDEYAKRVRKLKEHVETLPRVETQLQRLNRNYEVHKRNYTELVARREAAEMAEDVEQTGGDVKFKVIDPPRIPVSPSGPNRLQFMSLVMLAAIGGGGGLGLGLSQMRPAIFNRRQLMEVSDRPILGSVTLKRTKWSRLMAVVATMIFVLCVIALLFAYFGVMVIEALDLNFANLLSLDQW